jgi:hypothetical protein
MSYKVEKGKKGVSYLALALLFGVFSPSIVGAEKQAKVVPIESFRVDDENYTVELWAQSPMLYNPTWMPLATCGSVSR